MAIIDMQLILLAIIVALLIIVARETRRLHRLNRELEHLIDVRRRLFNIHEIQGTPRQSD